MFGLIQTHPMYIIEPGTTDAFNFAIDYTTIDEFEGVIDYLTGDRRNDFRTIHPDTTHIIITDFNPDLIELLSADRGTKLKDGEGVVYDVLNVDDPARQGHHLEIEVARSTGGGHND